MQTSDTLAYLRSQGFSATILDRFWSKVNKTKGCWLWTAGRDRDGYGSIFEGVHWRKSMRSHRASWIIHFGPIPQGMWVLHKCDNPPCVRPDHLFLGDYWTNALDMLRKGRSNHGPKLTEKDVLEIRRIGNTMTQPELGRMFGVQQNTISRILSGVRWRHI